MTAVQVYAPRPLHHLAMWQVGQLRVKPYHIGHAAPEEARVAAARAEAERMAAESEAEGEAHGLGFVVLHEGEQGTWLPMDWWAHGDILCQRLSRDTGQGFAPVDHRPLLACVWEFPVLCHERGAWVRHMMQGAPSPDAYLADRLAEGAV